MAARSRFRFQTQRQAMSATAARHRAIAAVDGPAALAKHLGMHPTSVAMWVFCPTHRIEAVEAASGVSRHDLRPDLYPAPPGGLTADERALPAHLAAGAFFARTGRCLSSAEGRP